MCILSINVFTLHGYSNGIALKNCIVFINVSIIAQFYWCPIVASLISVHNYTVYQCSILVQFAVCWNICNFTVYQCSILVQFTSIC